MEKGLELNAYILEQFQIEPADIRTYSPLTLAYIGDGVYDLLVRSLVVGKGNTSPNKLHIRTSQMVKAQSQSAMAERILPCLKEDEATIYRRGRNANSATMAKNASTSDYHKATGLEALMGYLYLKNDIPRLVELIRLGHDWDVDGT